MPRRRVPVLVLSGHLGSGKTTLLNHVLRTGGGRIGVVVNDFGQVSIDALLIGGHVDATAISGGCLCCLADTSELDDALRRLSRLDLDAVVIEASGLAEPRELARMVLASTVPGIRFGGVVEVLDASRWVDDIPVGVDHVRVASLLVVNKTDRAARDLEAVEARLREIAPATPVVRTVRGAVDPALLFDVIERPEPTGQLSLADLLAGDDGEGHPHRHEHARYDSVSYEGSTSLHPRRLLDLLDAPPAGAYRIKGVVEVTGVGPVSVHAVGDWYTLEPAPRGSRGCALVVIGIGLDRADVEARLTACADGGDVTPAERYAVERFLR